MFLCDNGELMAKTCADCGCAVYGGHCVNCHEEHYIMEQNNTNDPDFMIGFSNEFWDKVKAQDKKAKEIRDSEKVLSPDVDALP